MFSVLRKIYKALIGIYSSFISMILRMLGINISPRVKFQGLPFIYTRTRGNISIGKGSRFLSNSFSNPVGINHRCILRTLNREAKIIIGENCGFSGTSIVARSQITIGDNVLVGTNCTITDSDHHPISPGDRRTGSSKNIQTSPVKVGNNSWIGANSIILKGVKIGENSIVGAGSIVVSNVPPNTIYAGNPAKFIRQLNDD